MKRNTKTIEFAKRPGRTACFALTFALVVSLAACGRERIKPADETDEIVRAQVTNLASGDYTVRRCAARALDRIGPRAMNAVSHLLCALEDSEPTVRDAARLALDRIDPQAKDRAIGRLERKTPADLLVASGALRP